MTHPLLEGTWLPNFNEYMARRLIFLREEEQRWELIVKEANSVLRGEAKQQLEPTKNHYNGFLRQEIFLSNLFYKQVH